MSVGLVPVLPGLLFELRPYGFQARRWVMAGRVFSVERFGPGFLASLAPVMFVAGLGVSQVVVGLAGENEVGIAIAAGVMLANVLGNVGIFLTACVWSELQAWKERPR
jgi:hypothetical protein